MSIAIRYDNTSILNNIDNLAVNINAFLIQYRSDEYIESIVTLTVLMNVNLNDTILQCTIADLDSMSTNVFVNTSGIILMSILFLVSLYSSSLSLVPLLPTGFNITREYYTTMDNTVMFEWDPPPGSGPEAIVDNYTITITPAPVSHPISNVVITSPWNVTINYNVIYTATISAVNCAGDSPSLTLSAIEYSKCV